MNMVNQEMIVQEIADELIGNGWQYRPDTTQRNPMPLFLVAPEHATYPVIPHDSKVSPADMVDGLNQLNPSAARFSDEKCREIAVSLAGVLKNHFGSIFAENVANAVGSSGSEAV